MITEAFVILGHRAFDVYFPTRPFPERLDRFFYPNTGLSKKIKP